VEELAASEDFLSMTKDDWAQLTEEEFRRLFRHSAVKRTKFEGLSRNIEIVLNNISR
jgi:epoxyqueuosine reductase